MNEHLSSSHKKQIEELLKAEEPDWRRIEALSRAQVDSDPNSVRFSVDATHIQRLGAELVSKQETALSELIKNAYDADATNVTLGFSQHQTTGGTLVITDDGLGMTDLVIRDTWMRISTPVKADEPRSLRYGRVRAGRKGIGRFSVQRLGKRLIMETRPLGVAIGYRAEFDWDAQFIAGRDLTQVFNRIERFPKEKTEHGTTLTILDLRDSWSPAAIEKVWRSVLLLQPPFPLARPSTTVDGSEPDPGFAVSINQERADAKASDYSIQTKFLSQAIAQIDADIDEEGKAIVQLRSEKLNIDESQVFDDAFLVTGPVHLKAYYFIYSAKTLSGISQSMAAEMGRNFGGIRVYRNGFRVQPYGESSDDWLEFDRDVSRREILVPANNRNFFGQVELSSQDNPLFEETSSREGLLENEALQELRQFLRQAILWAIKRVAAVRNRKQDAGQKDFTPEARKPSEIARTIREQIEAIDQSGASGGKARHALEVVEAAALDYEEQVERERAAALQYEEMLRLLASLGLSVSVFGHEIKGSREAMQASLALLRDTVVTVEDPITRAKLLKRYEKLAEAANRVFDVGGYIAGLLSATESRELRTHSVKGALENFLKNLSHYLQTQGVSYELDVSPPELRTVKMHASEIDSALMNFLTNSVKSMKKARVAQRRIRIDGRRAGRHVVIGFEDNGVGISEEDRERIFDAFFTTTMQVEDDGVSGPGTGLGLRIVSDIASSYGGSVSVAQPSDGYHCRLEFRVLSEGHDA